MFTITYMDITHCYNYKPCKKVLFVIFERMKLIFEFNKQTKKSLIIILLTY